MEINIPNEIIEAVKIAALVFAFIHFAAGLILVSRISKMRSIVQTRHGGYFVIISYVYILILIAVLVMIALY
jgi:hypothetical protein